MNYSGHRAVPALEGNVIFRVLPKPELPRLFRSLSSYPVIGPVSMGMDRENREIFAFEQVREIEALRLDYTTTVHPAKRHVLPNHETLCTFEFNEDTWTKTVDYNVDRPHVFFGLHPCDINALNKLDKVLMESAFPTPYYVAKRRNMFIIGLECTPQPGCFCRSVGTDTVLHGFDMFLTDLGNAYFVEIQSAVAFNLLKGLKIREPREADHRKYMRTVEMKNSLFTTTVDTTDLTKILDMEFQSEVWKEWGDRCLSCGTCASVCPTCYCYGVEETVAMDFKSARKTKHLHSCNLVDFAEVAGGHNFRPERHVRLKYRYYHKHRGFVEAFEESLCVGCGRCGTSCLAGITVPEVIASIRGRGN